jgi:hypothetical protein
MFLIPKDTNIKAAKIQYSIFKADTIQGRLEKTLELSDNLKSISMEGITIYHPEYRKGQIIKAYLKLILNKVIFDTIYKTRKI